MQENGAASGRVVQLLLPREQFSIVDDWHVIGMQGTGSKRVVAEDVFVPLQRTIEAVGAARGAEPAVRVRIHENPMYFGRILHS